MSVLVSVAAAVAAGMFLAIGGVVQQREASQRPRGEGALVLMGHLLRDRYWLLGIGSAAASYGFQALALAFGPLALVQPLIVSELLFAVPFSVRLRGLRLRPKDWLAAGAVVAGLAVGIGSAQPHGGDPLRPITAWIPTLVGVAVLVAASILTARMVRGPARASVLALGGALVMATQSGLYRATIGLIKHGFWQTFVHWQPYLLIATSIAGVLLIQNAFHAGPLAASSPVIDAVLPMASVVIGVWVLGEQIRTSVSGLAGGAAGVVLLVVGIIGLDTSPVVRKTQRIERAEQEAAAGESSET